MHGGNGALLGGGDALLQLAHLGGQGGLVAHRRRQPAQEGGDLHAGQGVAVDVVDEEEHIAALLAEVLGHGEPREGHAQAVARVLVHLAVDQGDLVQNPGLGHLLVEVVALAGTLADAGENRITAVLDRDVADQFHHVHGLAHTGSAEQADLAALGERANQVNHLDTGFEQFGGRRQLVESRSLAMNSPVLFVADRTQLVDRVAQHVHDAAQGLGAHRH